MDAHTPVLTHRTSCSITCSSGPKLRLVKLNWHRMTNKILDLHPQDWEVLMYGCRSEHVLQSHTHWFDWQPEFSTPGCLWSGNKPAVLSSLAAFTVMDGGRERESWRWIKLEREDAGGHVFRNRMKALFEKRKMGWITRDWGRRWWCKGKEKRMEIDLCF